MKTIVLSVVFTCFLAAGVLRAGNTWDGQGADASWGTPENWSGNTLPAFNGLDALSFGTGFVSGVSMTLDGSRTVSSITQTTGNNLDFSSGTPTDSTLTLSGGNLSSSGGNQVHNENVILGRNGVFSHSGNANGTLTINGDITDNGSGYSLSKTGSRWLTLNGSNSFGGGVIFSLGVLVLGHNQALGTGPLQITGGSTTFRASGNRTITNDIEISTAAMVAFGGNAGNHLTVNAPGRLMLKNNVTLSLSQTDTYFLTVNTGIHDGGASNSLTVYGTRDFAVNGASTFSGTLSMGTTGGNACRFQAGGTMTTTNVVFNAGKLILAAHNPLGSGKLSINGAGDCTFDVGTRRDLDNEIEMKGRITGVQNGGFEVDFNRNGGSSTLKGNVDFELDNLPQTAAAPYFWRGIGERGGPWGITINGGSYRYFQLAGPCTYTGPTIIGSGILRLMGLDVLPTHTIVTIVPTSSSSGVLELNGNNTRIGSLKGDGYVTLGAGTLTIGGSSNTTYSGFITGSGGLIRDGSGVQVLASLSNLTYTGATAIRGGALRIDGRLSSAAGAVGVTGGQLEGTGVIVRAVNVLGGGRIMGGQGGDRPGLLTISSTLRLSNDAVVAWAAGVSTQSVLAVTSLLQDDRVGLKVINRGKTMQPGDRFPLIRVSGSMTGFNPAGWTIDTDESSLLTVLRNARVYAEDNVVYLTGLQSPASPGTLMMVR